MHLRQIPLPQDRNGEEREIKRQTDCKHEPPPDHIDLTADRSVRRCGLGVVFRQLRQENGGRHDRRFRHGDGHGNVLQQQVRKILDRYSAAEVATAGIFMSKYLDRKALTDLGIWSSATENYYYRRIYSLVSAKIMPKIWTVAGMMLRSPQTALYWGSYLFKVCHEVETLCMQFESIVTNSSLSFRDVVFLQLAPQFQPLFDLADGGSVDWRRFFDDLGSIPNHFNKENLKSDVNTLYDMGVSIAGAGAENMMEALLGGSSFNDIAKGNVTAIVNAAESSYGFYKALEHDLGGTLLSMVGGPENVARLFSIDSYNMTSWMTDYLRETMGQYYTQRWYIYRRDSGSETLCDYMPPTDDNSILYGGAWTRFNTTDADFYPSSAQTEQILSNSENYAGWSRNKVRQMNASGDGFHYSISYSRYAYILSKTEQAVRQVLRLFHPCHQELEPDGRDI